MTSARAQSTMQAVRSVLTVGFGVSYLVNVVLEVPALDGFNLVLMVVVLGLSLFASTGSSRTIGVVLIAVSAGLLLCLQAPLEVWEEALRQNADLVVMFIMIPLIGIPVQHGGYSGSLRAMFARYAGTEGRYYALVSGMAAVVGSLISIAAVPLTYEVSRESPHGANKRLLGTALTRGFVTCMIWAPTSATIALVVSLTGIDWVGFFPCAIASAVIAEAVGIAMVAVAGMKAKRAGAVGARVLADEGASGGSGMPGELGAPGALASEGASADASAPAAVSPSKVAGLGVFALVLIGFIAAVSQLNGLSVIVVVAMASLVWPFVWMLLIGRLPAYARAFQDEYFKTKLPNAKNQIVLFVAAGMLAQSIGYADVGTLIAQQLLLATGQSVLLLTVGIIAVALATSAVGIHPIVIVAVIGGAINPVECGMTPMYLALVLSISWALGNVICPASANVIAVSDMVGRSPIEVGPKWNAGYVAVTVAVLVVFLTVARAQALL